MMTMTRGYRRDDMGRENSRTVEREKSIVASRRVHLAHVGELC